MTAALDAILEIDFPAAQRGDHDAFARLVRATQRMVASVALAVTRDVPLSEDIAQETYLIAWQKLAAMAHRDSFLPWLRQVARNRAIDQVRKRRYAEVTLDDSDPRMTAAVADAADPDAARKREEQRELLARALDEIPDSSLRNVRGDQRVGARGVAGGEWALRAGRCGCGKPEGEPAASGRRVGVRLGPQGADAEVGSVLEPPGDALP